MFGLFGVPKSKCPHHCGFVFPEVPKRSNLCPKCKGKFYVRQGKLITEFEKLKLHLWQSVSWTGLNINDVDDALKKGGLKRKERDYLHGLFNLAILREKSGNNNPEKLSQIYSSIIYKAHSYGESYQHLLPLYEKEIYRSYNQHRETWTKEEIDQMVKEDIQSLLNSL